MVFITEADRFEHIEANAAHLTGKVKAGPEFNHKSYGKAYYMIVLGVMRKSGYEDRLRLIVSEELMGGRSPREGEWLDVWGQIRTYNREDGDKSRLEVTVFVKEMDYCGAGRHRYENIVNVEGYICKQPIRRTSPLGREICDLMIAVNRPYNKSDYIPAIAWGRNAAYCETLEIGDKIVLEGRIQSREYRKHIDDEKTETRIAYEVSAVSIRKLNKNCMSKSTF